MSSSTVVRKLALVLVLAGAAAASGRSARSAILVKIDGLPYAETYDTFLVATDVAGLANPRLGIVPKVLEFERDAVSGRPKFGVQYDLSVGNTSPFVSLTASLRYRQDQTEIRSVLTAAETKLGMGSGTLQPASLNAFTTKISFFVKLADGSLKTQDLSPSPSALNATYPVVVDLSFLAKPQLKDLLAGAAPAGGFVGEIEAATPAFERKNDGGDWENVIGWAVASKVLSIRDLTFPGNDLAKSRVDIRLAIALALGAPSIVSTGSSYVFGWDTTLPAHKAKLQKLVDDAKSSGALTKIADKYRNGSVMPLTDLCSSFGGQIVDISTGSPGCSGLAP
ncbi:hypothetical protein [Bradyrhizobium oligotrophicum]|uniref:hypothetical protein n=1 Tax=Bradyrhizobium TaxID=374 RepID=UPI003EBD2D09